jgi:flagellar hook protein FlgE
MGIGNVANSGMGAALTNMESISNNIANAETIGYKKSRVNFADVYPAGATASPGLGVKVQGIEQDFSTGGTTLTTSGTDFSLNNDGFFVIKDPSSGQITYTRNGHFVEDNEGYLTSGNKRLQGFSALDGQIVGNDLSDIVIDKTSMAAQASTSISMGSTNLNASDPAITDTFDKNQPTTYNHKSSSKVYDSLGNEYAANIYYVKTADNTWDAHVEVDNNMLGTGNLTFNSNGTLNTATGLDSLAFNPTSGATTPQTIGITVPSLTQFSLASKDGTITPDGYKAGTFQSSQIDKDGKVTLVYTNGQKKLTAQIGLADFISPAGLQKADQMSWQATGDSGDPIINQENSIGAIASNTLELSNVDLTSEMVKLISAQHTFQANAQVEKVYSEVLNTVIQL